MPLSNPVRDVTVFSGIQKPNTKHLCKGAQGSSLTSCFKVCQEASDSPLLSARRNSSVQLESGKSTGWVSCKRLTCRWKFGVVLTCANRALPGGFFVKTWREERGKADCTDWMQGLVETIVLFLSAVRTVLICLDDVPGEKGVPLGDG